MDLNEIEEKIKEIVIKQFGKEIEFDKIESIRFVELIVNIEDEFDIEFDDENLDVNVLADYKSIARYIADKLN